MNKSESDGELPVKAAAQAGFALTPEEPERAFAHMTILHDCL